MTDDFLDLPAASEQRPLTKEELYQKAIEFAQLYVETFVLNPSGRQLLAQWEEIFMRARTPVNATINEYVAAEARRNFVREIRDQIAMAGSRG